MFIRVGSGERVGIVEMISVIVAPANARQILTTPPQPRRTSVPAFDLLDLAILQEVQRGGTYGVRLWEGLNAVAQAQGPKGRADQRRFRLHLWHRTKALLREGVLFRFGRTAISTVKVARERAVRRKLRVEAGSTLTRLKQTDGNLATNHLSLNLINDLKAYGEVDKTQSVQMPEEVANAARSLARLCRKRWSGWLGETRSYRGMAVLLPSGKLAHVFGVLRGQVVVTNEPDGLAGDPTTAGALWRVVPARDVQIIKNPQAAALARLKRGVREKKSERKARAARANGCQPCAPGRRRGRPPKMAQPIAPEARLAATDPRPASSWSPRMNFEEAVAYYSQPQPR